jgi:hypothetical protein
MIQLKEPHSVLRLYKVAEKRSFLPLGARLPCLGDTKFHQDSAQDPCQSHKRSQQGRARAN